MIVLGGQRSPQNSAHHEHQRFWPRVSEAAGGFENAETIVNTVVFVLSRTFPRGGRHVFAQPTNASRPEPLMLMMRGWAAGRGTHHRGFASAWGSGGRASASSAGPWCCRHLEGLAGAPSFHTPVLLRALPAPGRSPSNNFSEGRKEHRGLRMQKLQQYRGFQHPPAMLKCKCHNDKPPESALRLGILGLSKSGSLGPSTSGIQSCLLFWGRLG